MLISQRVKIWNILSSVNLKQHHVLWAFLKCWISHFTIKALNSLVPGTNNILGCSLFCRNMFNRGRDAEKKQPDRISPTSASSSRNSAACEGKHASSKDERLQDGRGGLDRKSVVIIIRREFQEQEKSEIWNNSLIRYEILLMTIWQTFKCRIYIWNVSSNTVKRS